MKVIFLDIDGVLNNYNSWRKRKEYYDTYKIIISSIDEECVRRLSEIVRITGAKIVLSSSWRGDWANGVNNLKLEESKQLQKLFDKYNIEIVGITPCLPKSNNPNERYTSWRENEIKYYLETHLEIDNYCVIDDEDFDLKSLQENLIKINSEYGIEDKHVEKAIQILNQKQNVKVI